MLEASPSAPSGNSRNGVIQWRERMEAHGGRPCLATENSTSTYKDLCAAWNRARGAIESAGVNRGDVTLLAGDYSLDAIAWLLALAEVGAVVAPVAAHAPEALEPRARISGARRLIRAAGPGPATIEKLATYTESSTGGNLVGRLRATGHAGLILFSSGSTGEPKAMLHDLDNLLASYLGRRARNLSILAFLLFDHIGGLNTLFNTLAGGALLVIPPSRDPDAVAETLARHQVNVLPTSPTFLNLLLASGAVGRHDLSSLRVITYGTEMMPEALLARVREAFPKARLIQTFGTSETGIARTAAAPNEGTWLRLDDPEVEHKIVNGELWLRSVTQALGYLNAPMERFTPDGWFRTGDLVEATPDGRLRVLGRETEIINVGGEKVWPGEVESALLECPEVAACRVWGEPHALTGQTVVAQIVPAAPTPAEGRDALRARVRRMLRAKLSSYKVPAKLTFVDALAVTDRFKARRG